MKIRLLGMANHCMIEPVIFGTIKYGDVEKVLTHIMDTTVPALYRQEELSENRGSPCAEYNTITCPNVPCQCPSFERIPNEGVDDGIQTNAVMRSK